MLNEELFDFLAAGYFQSSYIGNHRNHDILDFHRSQHLCQTVSSGLHQRAMEGSAYRQQHCALSAGSLQSLDSLVDRVNSAGDNYLAGAVEVNSLHSCAHFGLHGLADFYDFVAVQAQNCGHGALAHGHSLLHELATLVHCHNCVSELHGTYIYQSGIFAQAVAGGHSAANAMLFEHSTAGGAGGKDSRLGVGGQLQVGGRAFEAHLANGIAQGFISLGENLSYNRVFIIECLAHTHGLGALSRKNESNLAHGKNLSFSNYTRYYQNVL